MDVLILIVSVFVLPVIVGYFYGQGQVDPYTTEGKRHYSKSEN